MTIHQALTGLDSAKFTTVSREEKIGWLSALDAYAAEFLKDLTGSAPAFSGYDANTDLQTKLLIEAPYDEIYRYWLEARVDYQNSEYDRFNNANAMYEAAWSRFADHCIRAEKPENKGTFC